MCHRAPRPPLTFTFQRGATDGGAGARHSPGARGPQRRRADTPRALPRTARARACDCARITVLKCSQPWIQLKCAAVKVETESPISVVQRARNSRAASHSPAGSVSQAWKWRKHRETAARSCAHRHPGFPRGGPTLIYHSPSVRTVDVVCCVVCQFNGIRCLRESFSVATYRFERISKDG